MHQSQGMLTEAGGRIGQSFGACTESGLIAPDCRHHERLSPTPLWGAQLHWRTTWLPQVCILHASAAGWQAEVPAPGTGVTCVTTLPRVHSPQAAPGL